MAEASSSMADPVWTRDSNVEHEDIWDDTALIDAYDRAVGQVKEAIAKKFTEDGCKKKKPKSKQKTWKVGDFCNTTYSEDGLNYEAYIKEISESGTNCLVQYIGYGNEEVVPLSALQPSLGKETREQQEILSQKEITALGGATALIGNNSMDWQRDKTKKTKSPSEKSHSHRKSKKCATSPDQHHYHTPSQPMCFHSSKMHKYHSHVPHQWPGPFNFPNSSLRIPPIPPPPPFPIDQESVKDDEALAAMLMSWYMSGYHTGFYQGVKQQSCQANCQSCKCFTHTQR